MTTPTIGLDISPTHGAMVQVRFDGDRPTEVHPLGHYPGTMTLPFKTPFMEMTSTYMLTSMGIYLGRWVEETVSSLSTVYVDFSLISTAFLPSGRMYSTKWSFLMGSFFTYTGLKGVTVHGITPGDVRSALGLKVTAKKEEVWTAFEQQFPDLVWPGGLEKLTKAIQGDYRDATVLAVIGGLTWA